MAFFWISNQKLMKFDYQGRVVIRAWSEKIKLAVVCRIKWTGRNRTRHPVKKKKQNCCNRAIVWKGHNEDPRMSSGSEA